MVRRRACIQLDYFSLIEKHHEDAANTGEVALVYSVPQARAAFVVLITGKLCFFFAMGYTRINSDIKEED